MLIVPFLILLLRGPRPLRIIAYLNLLCVAMIGVLAHYDLARIGEGYFAIGIGCLCLLAHALLLAASHLIAIVYFLIAGSGCRPGVGCPQSFIDLRLHRSASSHSSSSPSDTLMSRYL